MQAHIKINLTVAVAVLAATTAVRAAPITPSFTYQGQLQDAGFPANGNYDMRFVLFDAPAGGNIVAGPLIFDGGLGNGDVLSVVNGLFTVELDFGPAFDGTALWLQIQVRPQGLGGYATLSPRQPLTAAPFALYALDGSGGAGQWDANGGDIHNANPGNVGIGTDAPISKLHLVGSILADGGSLRSSNPNNAGAEVFLGWGTDANGDDVARIRIGGDGAGATNGLDIQRTSNVSLMRIEHNGNVGIGTADPASRLHVVGLATIEDASFQEQVIFQGGGRFQGGRVIVDGPHGGGATDHSVSIYVNSQGNALRAVNDGAGLAGYFDGVVQITGGSDTAVSGGGFVVTGATNGLNISIDNNEIMARNNGAASTLYLNNEGGDIVCGGALNIGYQIVTGFDSATCPAGKRVIAGGCRISGDAEVRGSYPSNNSWVCTVGDQSGFISLTSYAICVNVK